MTRRFILLLTAAALTLAALPAPVAAQNLSAGVFGGYFDLSGDEFDDADAGFGFGGVLAVGVHPRFEIGAGVIRTTHSLEGGGDDDEITALVIHAEPRARFPLAGSPVVPFVGARVGWVKEDIDIGGVEAERDGLGFGAVGGVEVALGPTVAATLAASFTRVSLGDAEVGGTAIDGTDIEGNVIGLEAGLRFRFGPR
ncbi:MAG TPA: outer membrane beta-barrel protein [Longimicrobium sp.]|nr:outer membrane beta-barrel protein [Longimicrobium sp.]